MTQNRYVARVRLITYCAIAVALILIGRLYYLQIYEGKEYAARATAQFINPSTPLTDRDSIYFTDKNGDQITAAAIKDGFTLAINPTKVVDAESLYNTLNAIIPIDHTDFITRATKPNTQYQVIAQHLSTDI